MSYDEDIYAEDESKERHLPAGEMLRRMGALLAPHWRILLLAGVLLVVVTAAELAGPLLVRHVLDADIPNGDTRGILFRAIAYAGLFAVGMGTAYFQVILLAKMGLRIVTRLREKVFEHLLSLSLAHFDKNPPGKLMARVESDVERLLILFSEVALALFRNGVLLLATFVVMLLVNAKITLSVLLILSPIIFISYFVLRYIRVGYGTVRRLYARVSGYLSEYVQGIPILQIYGYTEKAQLDLKRLNQEKYSKEWRVSVVEYGFWALFASMEVAAVLVIIYVGARQVLDAAMTIGTLILFIEYTRRLFFPMLLFSEHLNFIQRAFASADRVFAVLDTPSKTPDRVDASPYVYDRWKEISFDDVSFVYEGGVKALDGVSFKVRRGEKIALVGLSGGGKSTAAKLLLRFHEPTEGRVALDGTDIRTFKQKAWRRKIGLVLQDIHLFPGTVGDNLRVLKDEIPQEAVERAVRVVHADEMIRRLPRGYDTELSEGGSNLSMGERQIICFARAIVEDPDILVLDEATSSVDPATERRIQESLDSIMKGRTSIIVAHRLATITKVDRILVLNEGRLVEEGTHMELYKRGGIYRDLFDLQFAVQKVG
jgi:ATP-binding cassette subfamily B protein